MLKRTQIYLNDWIADHIKLAAEKYDVSFSELTRMLICSQIGKLIQLAYPEYRFPIKDKETIEIIRKYNKNKLEPEEFHTFISRLYFEARKAAEYWEKKQKK